MHSKNVFSKFVVLALVAFLTTAITSQDPASVPATTSSNDGSGNDKILEAIQICRQKLKGDPYFPKVQHSLALLLDSQIDNEQLQERKFIEEVIELYHAVGKPSKDVLESRIPPPKIRFESLVRAGTIANDILHDNEKAVMCLSLIHI